jgi:hypothetical protein
MLLAGQNLVRNHGARYRQQGQEHYDRYGPHTSNRRPGLWLKMSELGAFSRQGWETIVTGARAQPNHGSGAELSRVRRSSRDACSRRRQSRPGTTVWSGTARSQTGRRSAPSSAATGFSNQPPSPHWSMIRKSRSRFSEKIMRSRRHDAIRSVAASRGIDLIEADDDFRRNQEHHDNFEAQRAARVDDVGQRVGGFCDH